MEEEISDLSDTITPKSNQLNADHLISGPIFVRVTSIKRTGAKDQPLAIHYINHTNDNIEPFKPCLTMRRALFMLWGQDGNKWKGRIIKLYRDPTAIYAGEKVGGVRISDLTDLGEDKKIILTVSKGKRKEFLFRNIPTYPAESFEKNKPLWVAAIKEGKLDINRLIGKACNTGILTEDQILQLKKETELL